MINYGIKNSQIALRVVKLDLTVLRRQLDQE